MLVTSCGACAEPCLGHVEVAVVVARRAEHVRWSMVEKRRTGNVRVELERQVVNPV